MTGTIGDRIKAERERVGMSQEELARSASVSSRSQRNYEAGTRVPNADYLLAIAKAGIDISYVLTGTKTYALEVAAEQLLSALGEKLGIDADQITDAIERVHNADVAKEEGQDISPNEVQAILADMLAFSDAGAIAIDVGVLCAVIEMVEIVLDNRTLLPHKKAQIVSLIYRAAKESGRGKVNPQMVEDAISLAT